MAGQAVLFHKILHAGEKLRAECLDVVIEAVLERHADACVCRVYAELIAAVGAGYADYAAG